MFDVIFDFAMAGLALAPFGLLVFFWIAFGEDLGVHAIYRRPRTTTTSEIAGTKARSAVHRTTQQWRNHHKVVLYKG